MLGVILSNLPPVLSGFPASVTLDGFLTFGVGFVVGFAIAAARSAFGW